MKTQCSGVVVSAEAGFQVSRNPDTVRVPDVAFVRADRVPTGGCKRVFSRTTRSCRRGGVARRSPEGGPGKGTALVASGLPDGLDC